MDGIETEYRWRKKKGTGPHYFHYQRKRHKIKAGGVVDCPIRFVNPCLEQYDCLGRIDDDGNVVPVDIEDAKGSEQEQEEDIQLKVKDLGRGWYDVYNPENPDKPINDKALRRGEAYKLAGVADPELNE